MCWKVRPYSCHARHQRIRIFFLRKTINKLKMSFSSTCISLLIALCFVFQWTLWNTFYRFVFLWFYKVIYLVKDIYCQGDSLVLFQFSIICSAKILISILCQSYSIVKVAITFLWPSPVRIGPKYPLLVRSECMGGGDPSEKATKTVTPCFSKK